MKIKIFALLFATVSLGISAQQADSVLRSKKGTPILPQQGDWAIGADAAPYLEYLGNMFNNTANNSLNLGSQKLYGRYFLSNNTAIRVLIGISDYSTVNRSYITDDAALFQNPLSLAQTEDSRTNKYRTNSFNLGYQKFRGYGRLRGFYGANLMYSINRTIANYAYGNPITAANPKPSSVFPYTGNSRLLYSDSGWNQSIGAGLIAGVEYYFLPKVCIGGEISASVFHSWASQENSKSESWNGSVVVESEKASSPASRISTGIETSRPANYGGSLYLMFHF